MSYNQGWERYLNALELCLDQRGDLLNAVADSARQEASHDTTTIVSLPDVEPNAHQRSRALQLQSRLAQQALDFEAALASLTIEIERVEKLREAHLSRAVAEINAGGFEARA